MKEVELPDGRIAEFPDGMPDNQIEAVLQRRFPGQKSATDKTVEGAGSFAAGGNNLLPALMGIPVDTATNIANLGIAAYGTAKGLFSEPERNAAGVANAPDLPEPLGPQMGGSQSIRNWMEGLFGPVMTPSSGDANQRLAQAGGIVTAGALAPGSLPTNMARMVPSAIGADVMGQFFPDQPLAPLVGMTAGPVALQGGKMALSSKAKVGEFVNRLNKYGYKLPPALAKGSKTQQFVEGVAGPVPTKQAASIHNQNVTNNLIKRDLGYPQDAPLSPQGLETLRKQLGKVYESAKSAGTFKVDPSFRREIGKIASQGSAMAKEFPGLVKKDVVKFVNQFNKNSISANALVDTVKQLRAEANTGFRSQDPAIVGMARAKGKMANALEKLMERGMSTKDPDLLPALKDARQKIAKTYTVEKALKGDNVDAVALGREIDKGKPLTGAMKDVAKFGQQFKGAAQVSPPQQTNFRPMDLVAGFGSAAATQNPGYLALMFARPALRKAVLSSPYQKMVTRITPEQAQAISRLPEEAQIGATISLLKNLQESQDNQPQAEQEPQ